MQIIGMSGSGYVIGLGIASYEWTAAIGSAVLSFALKMLWPSLPFIDRDGQVFLSCLGLGIVVTLLEKSGVQDNAPDLEGIDFASSRAFNFAALGVILILTALYATWW